MIQAYLPSNDNYDQNGDIVLMPSKCEVNTTINGYWEMILEHPIDDEGRWEYLVNEGVIKAPLFDKEQLFIIRNISKGNEGITVKAEPIFMRSMDDCILLDIRPTNKNGQQALDIMTQGSRYKGKSNITRTSTAYYVRKNLIEAIGSDDENSFLNRWGGEIDYDNFTIIINDRIGEDKGTRISYGYNIAQDGFSEEIDTSNVATRIFPLAYNGRMISDSVKYVDSPHISNFPCVKVRFITYDDIKLKEDANENEENVTVCETQAELNKTLKQRAKEEFDNGADQPTINIKVEMVLLENTTLYKDVKNLERVYLGDDVLCENKKLGISTKARIISCTYDCIRKKTTKVEIGDATYDYFKNASSILKTVKDTQKSVQDMASNIKDLDNVIDAITDENGKVKADMLKGIIDMMNVNFIAQKNVSQKQDVRAILFEDTDPKSQTYGALCIGTQGLQISKKRNAQDTDWVWGTAIDSNSVHADLMTTGIITDKKGKFSLNLDSGAVNMKDGTFSGTVNATNGTFNGTVNASSGTFNGTVNATNGTFTGTVNAKSGTIGGFNISNGKITFTKEIVCNYTKADMDRIEKIIVDEVKPTSDDLKKYDITNDGRINALDLLMVGKIIENGNKCNVVFTLNPNITNNNYLNDDILSIKVDPIGNETAIKFGGTILTTNAVIKNASIGYIYDQQ